MTNSEVEQALYCAKESAEITLCEECKLYETCDHSTRKDIAQIWIEALEENTKLKAEIEQLKEESEQSAIQCTHGYDKRQNEIGETLIYCEYTDKWMNVTLGECLGNCEAEQSLKSLKSLNGKVEE